MERGALSRFGLHPNASAVALDNLFGDRQAHAGAGVLGKGMQALENDENPVSVLRIETNPVVAHGQPPLGVPVFGRDVDARRLGAVKFQCVPNQVLEDLGKLRGVTPNQGRGSCVTPADCFLRWLFAGS